MLRLFQSLFGHEQENVCYPESFIRETIERTVDGTDPWFRGLSGYRRTLRPAVVKAVGYAADLVDRLEAPLCLEPGRWAGDPQLHAFFVSEDRMRQVLQTHPMLTAFRSENPSLSANRIYGFLRMTLERQPFMGVDRVQGILTQGVKQILVSFKEHQLCDLATDVGEVRRLVKQRAFNHLLQLALHRLALASGLRDELETRAKLLQVKMDLLKKGQWGFDANGEASVPRPEELTEQLDEIETLLAGVGDQTEYLENNLEVVVDLLSQPERHLWIRQKRMILDRDGILRKTPTKDAPEFTYQQISNDEGWSMTVSLVEIPLP